ncbi:MAG TPA: methyltransferase domain-containing protein, partial [Candidatus Polarisedimenticolia bacterium]|nr:methyltransferase domain-containing protein [Candidatus Polarisedimenticolia bacterium]
PPGGFESALDLGCGKGAFTANLIRLARSVTGIELSEIAVAKARVSHPSLTFLQGDARRLARMALPAGGYDLVVSSDLIYYLTPREAETFLLEIKRLLAPAGRLFLAAWSPGGRYHTPESLEEILARHFALLRSETLPSRHAWFMARHRWQDLILSVDYETWQPIPEGKRIDWKETVLRPAEKLMLSAERFGARVTFFVEMGEILWLRRNDPAVAIALEDQIRDARRRGHDVQLHLHPEWLPESSPRHDPATGRWSWDEGKNRIHSLEEPPDGVLRRLKEGLEGILRPVDPGYRVRVFRAGKYRIQPHTPVFEALTACGIPAESSVWHGGYSFEHRFDFRGACSTLNPYFPSPSDVNLPAPPAEESVLEFPILSREGLRFSLDGSTVEALLERFDSPSRRDWLSRFKTRHPVAWHRMAAGLRKLPGSSRFPRLDREPAGVRNSGGDDTLIAIGHTKGDLRVAEIERFLEILSKRKEVRFRTFAEVVEDRLSERRAGRGTWRESLEVQVGRESEAVLGDQRNEEQSIHLQEKVPADRRVILDLGCGAGYWAHRLAKRHGFCLGVDYGESFLRKARSSHAARVARADFHHLPFPGGTFDAVYADNVLEHSPDPGRLLREIYRVLGRRGLLAAALPPDARNPRYPVSDHLWKTDRSDLESRLRDAGFTRVRVEEVDTVRRFGMAPYPASDNAMFYVTAWKNGGEDFTDRDRARDLMEFVYRKLDPSKSQDSLVPEEILRGGFAWCLGYCAVLGEMAKREGIAARYVTLEAEDHPRGLGKRRRDTHELVELRIGGRWIAFDPMANRILEGSVEELLSDPSLADRAAASRLQDERFRSRSYHLYCSSFFYERVVRFCRRESLTVGDPWRWIRVRRRPGT